MGTVAVEGASGGSTGDRRHRQRRHQQQRDGARRLRAASWWTGWWRPPSRVHDGPDDRGRGAGRGAGRRGPGGHGYRRDAVRAVGLDTPGPASADGVISSKGATNFSAAGLVGLRHPGRAGAPARPAGRLQQRRQRGRAVRPPRVLRRGRGASAPRCRRSSAPGWAAASSSRAGSCGAPPAWPASSATCTSRCTACSRRASRCRRATAGFTGDAESVASLTGIVKNLLPYWLARYPEPRAGQHDPPARAAKLVRGYGERRRPAGTADLRAAGDGPRPAVHDRRQLHRPARVLRRRRRGRGRPGVPGLVPGRGAGATPSLREEQRKVVQFALVPDLDMAGARGAALAAAAAVPD